ncbi:hypothetical protein MAM1_0317c09595 [Mucor ambiguus]|uniref:Uncharacterized protein n=1 Tax=Mucor ambiguus TaxID=91626 RepID=A0A0C9LXG8_9FUNG|nr:hypothetical protein MAM1_0317c09595 [Mucor ambiguus]
MNRIKSFEKHMDPHVCHAIYHSTPSSIDETSSYYSQQRSKRGDNSSISSNSVEKIYPLTLENLSKVELAEPSSMPLARYCNEIRSASSQVSAYPESNISSQRRSPQRRVQQQDRVIESPRLLPFPYHNDSHFLPTAEHDYPGGCSTTDASSSLVSLSVHTVASRQYLASPPSLTFPNRVYHRQLITPPRGQHENYYNTTSYNDDDMTSSVSQKRRATSVTPSSPSTLREDIMVPQKKRRSNNRFASKFKKNLLRFKSNSSTIMETASCQNSYYSPSASAVWTATLNDHSPAQQHQTAINNTSWFEKLWKFFRPSSTSFVKKSRQNASSASSATGEPVWYSQFRCNPPPPSGITLLS